MTDQIVLGILQIIQNCIGIKYIDVQTTEADESLDKSLEVSSIKPEDRRRFWLVNSNVKLRSQPKDVEVTEEEKDERLKSKISSLVDQTLYDTERKISSVRNLKEKHRDEAPYRVGFLLSMIKKSKEVLSELFNVAIKHKDDWKALEQLKIFELIVHTNVDTTNLVRQLVEIHVEHLNSTSNQSNSRRVVLIRK
ncbi:unnamed protein product [Euphydryas editha]|uniref:Uncharacterized protein n=1 Tax=Euphydryas editha TaxID=104508 RepID=A0AAU9TVY6_EUPED|nr:unnamed protein product [Euphydryas editha]